MNVAADVTDIEPTALKSMQPKARNPRIAALLAIVFDTLGLVYCGRLRRAVFWLGSLFVVLLAIGCLLLYLPNGRIAWLAMAALVVSYKVGLIADTIRIARRRELASRAYQKWWFYIGYHFATGIFILGVVQLSRTYWEEAFVIPAGSMDLTILAGDRILVDKLRYQSTPIRHGDIIVFWLDNQQVHLKPGSAPPGRLCHVKRVVGLPGDVIEFRDEKLLRNGVVIDEPYAKFSDAPGVSDPRLINSPSTVVGKDELFVVGDNRRESWDSRIFGRIPRDDVVGKVAIIYWSNELPRTEPAPVLPHSRVPPKPEPPRRIRAERFGLRPQ